VASSSISELLLAPTKATSKPQTTRTRKAKGKGKQMEASYEVLGVSDQSEEEVEEIEREEVNGEEVRERITGFMKSQVLRTAIAGTGFVMSVIGIWGDGVNQIVYIEV
jgi:autophagy-related protein 33